MTKYFADINPYFGARGEKRYRVYYNLTNTRIACAYQSNSLKLANDRAEFMTKNSMNDPKIVLNAEAKVNI